jgi:hypothetical protein
MHTFYQIIQYLFNNNAPIMYLDGTFEQSSEYMQSIYAERIKLPDNPTRGPVKQFFFMHMLTNKYSVITKFALLKDVFENIFSNEETREEFLNYFCKMQRIYFLLVKHAYRYKMRKTPVQVSTDVFMTPLREGDGRTLAIVQYGKKYLFSTSDLINIINSSLSHTSYFFAEPLVCKNPYNNIPFNKSTLYNMYFFIKKSTFLLPVLFHYYFMENFNLKRFGEKHEVLIREKSIKRHVEKTCVNELYDEITTILHVNRYTRKLYIDNDFPKDRLVNIMRPYLHLYYLYTCSTDLVKRDAYEKEFNEKMMNFYLYNKRFGRKYYKRDARTTNPFIRRGKHKYIISFDDDHLKFHNADEELRDFKYSHIHIAKLNDDEDDDEEESITDVDE